MVSPMAERQMSVKEARQQLPSLIQEAYYRGDRVIIARHGRPMAVIMPIEEYERWKARRQEAFAVFDRIWEANKDADPGAVERIVAEEARGVTKRRRRRR